jgi:hypothetical protein
MSGNSLSIARLTGWHLFEPLSTVIAGGQIGQHLYLPAGELPSVADRQRSCGLHRRNRDFFSKLLNRSHAGYDFLMTLLRVAGVMLLGAAVVYLFSAGLIIRATPPYNEKFVPLESDAAHLSTVVYAPVTWTANYAPQFISAPLRAYLEWWGCTFPEPPQNSRTVHF